MNIKDANTLFLDRDGVINKRIPGAYIQHSKDFAFLDGSLEAIVKFSNLFDRIIVVTNQQGVGKGIMSQVELDAVHAFMLEQISDAGGKIDRVYTCTKTAKENPKCRKPNIGMGEQAKLDFPAINFKESIMVGDSISDMGFAQNLGMIPVFMEGKTEEYQASLKLNLSLRIHSLLELIS